jgi:NIPSNAP
MKSMPIPAGVLLFAAGAAQACCNVVELRQYTLHPGQRDVLIELFDREFVESQDSVGSHVLGQFRDADAPDRYVWLRGFTDMPARAEALTAFYGGPVWDTFGAQARATMIDSSNVLLLRPVSPPNGFVFDAPRPAPGSEPPRSLVTATIYSFAQPVADEFVHFFEHDVAPALRAAGIAPIASFRTESAANNYPRLPVRENEHVFVWFARFASTAAHESCMRRLSQLPAWTATEDQLHARLNSPVEVLRLQPTGRSQLR